VEATVRQDGFSLLELLISMTLMVLGLALAAQLLLESHRTFALSGRAAREPLAGYAVAQLTADIQGASGAQAAVDGALLLTGHPEGTLRWERRGETLLRTVIAADGTVRSRRPVLQRVTAWSWSWSGDLVTAVLAYRRGSALRYVTTPELPPEVVREERLVVQVHPRGLERWNRW
jgi:prepilin-type N-terminal cleavage/methylation domain-containing protein